MSSSAALLGDRRPRPGRPSTGARERIVAAAYGILSREGYAGLTTAKVAAEAGQNKALISYHFGGKQGLVAEVARLVAAELTEAILEGIATVETVEELSEALVSSAFAVMDRGEGVQRIYFDLASQSVVDPEVESILRDVKAGFREVLGERLRVAAGLEREDEIEAAAVYLIAGVEGLALERLDRGETPALERARRLWVRGAAAALAR